MTVIVRQTVRIAIDGPAAAGKSTVAKRVADEMSFTYVDTGAMYRALTLKAIQADVPLNEENKLMSLLSQTDISLIQEGTRQQILLDGIDATLHIRADYVTNNVSTIAKLPRIREEMVKRQRALAENNSVVMDGRDIGTYVLPNAEVKVFLNASVEERAKRRHAENVKKGFSSNIEQLKHDIKQRDLVDSNRSIAPLIKAEDAIEIDTTSLTISGVVQRILKLVYNKVNGL